MLGTLTVTIVLLIVLGVPLGFAIILGSAAAIIVAGDINPIIIGQRIFAGMDSFILLAIPFFVLTGSLMTAGGMTERLIAFANAIVGRYHGGLAMSNVMGSTFFGGISGSAVADTSALGSILIPAMNRSGYERSFSAAVTAASSVVAPIIPPSIGFVVLGYLTDQSIVRLFVAGIVPGLIYIGAILVLTWWLSYRRRYPIHAAPSLRQLWSTFLGSFWALALPVFILGGIISGVFTVTECAAIAVAYALIVGALVYRELTLKTFIQCLVASAKTTAVIMILVAGARLFSWVLAYGMVPVTVANFMLATVSDPLMFLLLLNLLLLLVGMFMEANAAFVMLVPVLFPIAQALGVDPIQFNVIFAVNLCIGLITPPVGLCLNLSCHIARTTVWDGAREVLPYLGVGIAVLLLLTLFPGLSTWLPRAVLG